MIMKNDLKIKEIAQFVGKQTNNRAEYLALKKALEVAIEIDNEIMVFSDSKFIVQQRNKQYKIRNKDLKILLPEKYQI